MDTTFPSTPSTTWPAYARRWLLIVGIALLVSLAAESVISSRSAEGDTALSPQQIVTRGEVADRYAAQGDTALSPQQIVTRGEVADRYAAQGDTALSPQQIVTRGEVADRYAK